MGDLPPNLDDNRDTGVCDDTEPVYGMPRWVKAFGIVAIIIVLLFAVLHLAGRGLGGHGQHSAITEQGTQHP